MIRTIPVVALGICLCTSAFAVTDGYEGSLGASSSCDSICQLKAQDMAFALLLETFRQFKGCRIEQQYQSRLQTAESLPERKLDTQMVFKSDSEAMKKLQEFVRMLARSEHDLEMEGLQTQVVNFENAYNCIRRTDEAQLGIIVTNGVNLRAAAKKLKEFVIVSQGAPSSSDFQPTDPIPAETVLLDVEPSIPSESQLIEACQ